MSKSRGVHSRNLILKMLLDRRLPDLLFAFRSHEALSQKMMAEEFRVPFRTYQDWEYGRRHPRFKSFELIVETILAWPVTIADIEKYTQSRSVEHDLLVHNCAAILDS